MIEPCRRLYMLLLSDGVSEHFNNQKRFHTFTFRSPGYRGERKGGGGSVSTSGTVAKRLLMLFFSVFCLIGTIL